jgi:hypothetical protein
MGIAIRKEGFTTAGKITLAVIDDMLANGFKAIFPVDGTNAYVKPSGATAEKFNVTLEAGPDVDPLNPLVPVQGKANQPWRVAFAVTDNATMGMFIGSPVALKDDGSLPYTTDLVTETTTTSVRIVGARGIVGDDYSPYRVNQTSDKPYFPSPALFQPHWKNKTEGFINRRLKVWVDAISQGSGSIETPPLFPTDPTKDVSATYPMSYYLAITPRGFFLSIWQGAGTNVSGTDFSWCLVQRPVKRDTGEVVTEGKAPVFCVSAVGNQIHRFVVREADLVDASIISSAVIDTKDTTAIINDKKQIGVSENNQYIVNYPSRLNTPRYAYTYELDMIGYASATVVGGTTEVPQTLYGEDDPRMYIGMHANILNNNGMRIVALLSGGGIAPVTP